MPLSTCNSRTAQPDRITASIPRLPACCQTKSAAVEGVTPHTFRHTVATQLVRAPEVDLGTATTFLGHGRLDTTARYSQPSAEDLEEAAKQLG
jgi:site-specific recombinase XerD